MTQVITPQLRQWIVEQAQAGHAAEAVLKSMLASGWAEDVAVSAMESTLSGHLRALSMTGHWNSDLMPSPIRRCGG